MKAGEAAPSPDVSEKVRTAQLVLAVMLSSLALVLALAIESGANRLRVLSGFLLVLAVAEGFFGVQYLFRPRTLASDPDRIYTRQHQGIYSLFAVLLYVIAAFDPVANVVIVRAVIALYVVHAGYELACALGIAPPGWGGFRSPRAFLVDGLVLLAVIFPVAVFHATA